MVKSTQSRLRARGNIHVGTVLFSGADHEWMSFTRPDNDAGCGAQTYKGNIRAPPEGTMVYTSAATHLDLCIVATMIWDVPQDGIGF